MTGSSPQDLAVAFRSLGRRFREAQESEDSDDAATPGAVERLRSIVQAAGKEVGVATVGDVSSMGEVVGSAIEAVPPDQWDVPRLDRLRALALEAGQVLRSIAGPTRRLTAWAPDRAARRPERSSVLARCNRPLRAGVVVHDGSQTRWPGGRVDIQLGQVRARRQRRCADRVPRSDDIAAHRSSTCLRGPTTAVRVRGRTTPGCRPPWAVTFVAWPRPSADHNHAAVHTPDVSAGGPPILPLADEELVERARTDPDAFAELYRRNVNAVHAFAYRRSRSMELADEVTSSTFERALRGLPASSGAMAASRPGSTASPPTSWPATTASAQRLHSPRGRRAAAELHGGTTIDDGHRQSGPPRRPAARGARHAERALPARDHPALPGWAVARGGGRGHGGQQGHAGGRAAPGPRRPPARRWTSSARPTEVPS